MQPAAGAWSTPVIVWRYLRKCLGEVSSPTVTSTLSAPTSICCLLIFSQCWPIKEVHGGASLARDDAARLPLGMNSQAQNPQSDLLGALLARSCRAFSLLTRERASATDQTRVLGKVAPADGTFFATRHSAFGGAGQPELGQLTKNYGV